MIVFFLYTRHLLLLLLLLRLSYCRPIFIIISSTVIITNNLSFWHCLCRNIINSWMLRVWVRVRLIINQKRVNVLPQPITSCLCQLSSYHMLWWKLLYLLRWRWWWWIVNILWLLMIMLIILIVIRVAMIVVCHSCVIRHTKWWHVRWWHEPITYSHKITL